VSLVVGVYLAMQEMERAMGEGALFRLLFERPINGEMWNTGRIPAERP
jgi:hypothetical protein